MLEIIAKVNQTVKKYNMLQNDDFVVVGVSGGADSMALLKYLESVKNEYNLRLLVANVEHGIRGQESIDDTNFVKQYCIDNNLDFKSISINAVVDAKKSGLSVEDYSRNKRYDFFSSFNPDKIATAHNLSDNVETVLFRIARGTSIKGLSGIPAVRGNIIRPLIDCTGAEIRGCLDKNNIPYRIDSTNDDDSYSRNRIRNNIIPQFEKINSSFEQNVLKLINSSAEDENYLSSIANEMYISALADNSLQLNKLRKLPLSIKKRVIIKYFDDNGISLDELHLLKIVGLLDKFGKYQISNDIYAVSNSNELRIANHSPKQNKYIIAQEKIISYSEFLNNCELLRKQFDFYGDYDKIDGKLILRNRLEGDTISPANRNCTKSLKKLFNELRINQEDRAVVPLICDEKGIIAVCGYCVDERIKITNDTKNVILLKILSEDNI